MQKKEEKKKKDSLYGPKQHQMHCLGPFRSLLPFPSYTLQITIYIYGINISQYPKIKRRNEKKLTYGPNDAKCIVFAHFHHHCPSCCVCHRLHQIYATNIVSIQLVFIKNKNKIKKEKKNSLYVLNHVSWWQHVNIGHWHAIRWLVRFKFEK